MSAPVCWVEGPGSGNAPLVVLRWLHCGSPATAWRSASRVTIAKSIMQRCRDPVGSLKIINHTAGAIRLESFFDEFQVQRMDLIIVLRLFVWKDKVESNLVALIH